MEETEPPASWWLHGSVVLAESAIEGVGLFAGTDLGAGTRVMILGGRLVSTEELAALIAATDDPNNGGYVDTITAYPHRHLVLPPATPIHSGNHSCDPNLWFTGPYEIQTRRPVAAGEELTLDYATCSGLAEFRMNCECGSALCRGEVTGQDWERADLQARYGDHWVPALQER